MARGKCACGCGRKHGLQRHHIVYQQEIRKVVSAEHFAANFAGPAPVGREMALLADRRNIVMLGFDCHGAHHNASRRLDLSRLPDSAFEFARELLGGDRAYEYLRRRYAGEDQRLWDLQEDREPIWRAP